MAPAPAPAASPALTSNSFRLGHAIRHKPCPFVAFAKPKDADGQAAAETPRRSPFFVDFAKLPDAKSLIPVVSSPSASLLQSRRRKDPNTVFVAGATGQAGVRITQRLLRQGFAVRAGVPDLASAQELARVAVAYKVISTAESKRLNAVESAFDSPEAIAKAIGPAAKVVITIGAGENGPANVVTTDDALNVVLAADLAGVAHVVVVYDAGTGLTGQSTYNVLDGLTSFFSNLFSRTQPLTLSEFLGKVAETEVGYTVVKAALTDDYSLVESSSALVVNQEGTGSTVPVGAEVSKSQIAKLVADVFSNTTVAENKVVEVSTSPSATSKPVSELFSAIPEDGRREAIKETLAKVKAEEEALQASLKAEAKRAGTKLGAQVKKVSEEKALTADLAEEARKQAEAAGLTLDGLLTRAKGLSGDFSWEKLSSQLTSALNAQSAAEDDDSTPLATTRGQAKARKLPPLKAVVKPPPPQRAKPNQAPAAKPEVRSVFGVFKQETIYMDED